MNPASIAVGIVLILLGTIVLYFALKKIQEQLTNKEWPSVEATIQNVQITKHQDESGKFYNIALEYSYELGEYRYTRESALKNVYEKKRHLKQKYAPGLPITAYYNPENPRESVLESGINMAMIIILLLIPAILIIVGISLLRA